MDTLQTLWNEALDIWSDGGWAMYAIAVIAILIFGLSVHVYLKLSGQGLNSVPERIWRRWIDHPHERRGKIGAILDFVTAGGSMQDMTANFTELRTTQTAPFERDLKVIKICVSAAPLVGLLGTVTGMLATFGALSSGSGGDQTMGLVAKGISEALITTETGLVVALPGLFFQYMLVRKFERAKAFVLHLETVCKQTLYRDKQRNERRRVKAAAQAHIKRLLQSAVS